MGVLQLLRAPRCPYWQRCNHHRRKCFSQLFTPHQNPYSLKCGKYTGKRDAIVKKLADAGVEVRPIVAGNFTKNKVIEYMDYTIYGTLDDADYIHENGFFVGNHSKQDYEGIDYFVSTLCEVLKEV